MKEPWIEREKQNGMQKEELENHYFCISMLQS